MGSASRAPKCGSINLQLGINRTGDKELEISCIILGKRLHSSHHLVMSVLFLGKELVIC